MENKFLQDVGVLERVRILKDSAISVQEFTYPRKLSQEEISLEKTNFIQDQITINKEDKKLKDAKAIHKLAIDPVKKRMSISLERIKNKVEIVSEDVYLLDDQEEGVMGYYNSEGILVNQRPLLPEEKQLRITPISKTGTNS